MKKSKVGVIIVAIVMIVVGLGLFIGGIIAAGGISAAKDAMFRHGVDLEHIIEQELEDEFDIDLDMDEDGLDIDLDIDF